MDIENRNIAMIITQRDNISRYIQKWLFSPMCDLRSDINASPAVMMVMATKSATLITSVRPSAILRRLNQVRFSMMSDERLKACIKLVMPFVAKYKADTNPMD